MGRRILNLYSSLAAVLLPVLALLLLAWLLPRDLPESARVVRLFATGAVLGATVVLALSAHALRELYGTGLLRTLIEHLRAILRLNGPTQVIEEGETVLPPNAGDRPLLGPRQITLRSSAAVLFRGPRQTRVEGPGTFRTEPWEYVRRAYDLQSRTELLVFDPVLTQDQMPARIEFSVTYGVAATERVIHGRDRLDGALQNLLSAMDLESPDIRATTRAALEHEVRRQVGRLSYEQLARPDAFQNLDQLLRVNTDRQLSPRGLKVYHVTVTNIGRGRQPAEVGSPGAAGQSSRATL